MNRRELLATGMLLAVASCTESTDEATDDPSGETNQSETNDSEETATTNEKSERDTAIEITSIDAPETTGQTELFDVSVAVNSAEPGDVTVSLVDANNETVDEVSTEITGKIRHLVDETFRDHAAEWESEASEIESEASGRQTESSN